MFFLITDNHLVFLRALWILTLRITCQANSATPLTINFSKVFHVGLHGGHGISQWCLRSSLAFPELFLLGTTDYYFYY